jgi:ubiquinone biosynthesis protein
MSEQIGWRGFLKSLRDEAPRYATLLPQLPRLLHDRLNQDFAAQSAPILRELLIQQKKRNVWLMVIALLLGASVFLTAYIYFV